MNRYLANVPLIFRKQVRRIVDPQQASAPSPALLAGYTALVESRVPIVRLRDLEMAHVSCELYDESVSAHADIAERLGIKNRTPLFGVAVRDCTLDIQRGREIWVAEGYAPYIPPLAAPGNDLIRDSMAFNVWRRSAPSETQQQMRAAGTPAPLDVVDGLGEAYFGKTHRQAVAALLDRHFPAERRPLPDPDRDYVVLMFVRAADSAAVRLFEFGVWVPVVHEGQRAWYVPYMFRSPGAAVIHAREWFGHPCQEAFIEFQHELNKPRTVALREPVARGTLGLEWVRSPGIVFEPVPSVPDGYRKLDRAADTRTLLAEGAEQHVVGLLQVRHVSDTTRACVQQVVRSRRTVAGEIDKATLFAKVTLPPHLRLGRLLDLDGDARVHGYRLHDLQVHSTPSTVSWSDSK